MSAHTEGRLTLGKHGIILGGPGRELKKGIAYDQLFMACVTESGDQQENARRLAACWNAMDGATTEQIESFIACMEEQRSFSGQIGTIGSLYDERNKQLDDTLAERDQLRAELAALTSDEATAHDLLVAEIKKTGQLHHELAAARALLAERLSRGNTKHHVAMLQAQVVLLSEEIAAGRRSFNLVSDRFAEMQEELAAANTERKRLAHELAVALAATPNIEPGTGDYSEIVRSLAGDIVHVAGILGQVLTVSQVPRLPLAMGNYDTVVAVRPARVMAEKGGAA